MEKAYFNSFMEKELYKKLKVEAVRMNITIKQHISNILSNYIKQKETNSNSNVNYNS